ncbi:MAG: phosphatidylserine/phosphatidylglycerophosphate/cardiolipin synthase family protein [Candidatus Riflebacteria bacterium]|nr:phosphatidylserine/phosphatidylglycerophosphate/cardiolipin synthase family protein [Candidatus Riflebacteria bacterium]
MRSGMILSVRLISLVMLFILNFLAALNAQDSRYLYERYLNAFRKYQSCMGSDRPESEIQQALKDYQTAKSAYFKATKSASENDSDYDSENISSNQNTAHSPAGIKGTAQKTSYSASSGNLKTILQNLWSESGRKNSDAYIERLRNYIAGNPRSPDLPKARYELAKAYEILKEDLNKSEEMLQELAADNNAGNYQNIAKERIGYVQATKKLHEGKAIIIKKQQAMAAAYSSYRATSWLALPVKIFRHLKYAGKFVDLNSSVSDLENFQLWYENLAAPFTPSPDVCFDRFKSVTGYSDSEGEVRLLYQNSQAWYTRWKLLNEATKSIDVQYFIVEKDVFGMSLSGLLLRKAKEGLKIRYMLDTRGTSGFTKKLQGQDFLQELMAYPNVEVKVFNPIHQNLTMVFLSLKKMFASNHDKIIVVDNEYSILGGRNISMNYFVDPEDFSQAYRDCDVVIRSKDLARHVAKQLDMAFEEEFQQPSSKNILKDFFWNLISMAGEMEAGYQAMNSFLEEGKFYNPANPDKKAAKALKKYNAELAEYKHMNSYNQFDPFEGSHLCPIKVIDKHSMAGYRNDITDQIVKFVDGSKREILIQNPYVVLTPRSEAALKRASIRGVKIKIHTNSPISTDSLMTQAMFYADWKKILKDIPTSEIHVYYGDRKLHAKNFVFDGVISVIGTYNMDYLSEKVNSEVVAAIKSKEFAEELRGEIMNDISQSKQYLIKINEEGEAESVFGPDNLKSSKSWLIKILSNFGWLKPLI